MQIFLEGVASAGMKEHTKEDERKQRDHKKYIETLSNHGRKAEH